MACGLDRLSDHRHGVSNQPGGAYTQSQRDQVSAQQCVVVVWNHGVSELGRRPEQAVRQEDVERCHDRKIDQRILWEE